MRTEHSIFRANRVFLFLSLFRWASLLPALFSITATDGVLPPVSVLLLALAANIVISVSDLQFDKLVIRHRLALGVDLLFSALILYVSGGLHSPYYLYALSPLMAGAFFYQTRGALTASLLFTPLFIFIASPFNDLRAFVTQLAGIWLLPLLFAYPAALLHSLRQTNQELAGAHRQLEIIHELTVLLQAAPDLISVQERVLGALTTDLGFAKAVVATVDPAREEIGGWMVYPPDESFPATNPLPLKSENGEVIRALLNRTSEVSRERQFINASQLNQWLSLHQWLIIPLYLREHPVGVLLVDETGSTPERESTLLTVANQAALALGTTILCIDRARRLAVETERNRIARDIHDTVAQSLFGIVYSLDACVNMLPAKADEVKNELIELRALANNAHDEVRRSIFDLWPSALTMELFMADLSNYVSSCCRPRPFSVIFNHNGDFNSLSSGMKRTVYRMAQEALANSARHSGAQVARLCLSITENEVYLVVTDEGKGFDPTLALSRSQSREHFGLHGMQERVRAMGGEFEIVSQPEMGARVMIQLPILNGHRHA